MWPLVKQPEPCLTPAMLDQDDAHLAIGVCKIILQSNGSLIKVHVDTKCWDVKPAELKMSALTKPLCYLADMGSKVATVLPPKPLDRRVAIPELFGLIAMPQLHWLCNSHNNPAKPIVHTVPSQDDCHDQAVLAL